MVAIVAAGHNTGLQPAAFVAGGVLPRRHPWLRFHCTAAAGRAIMMRVSVAAWAAAETKRYAAPDFLMDGVGFRDLVFLMPAT